MINIDSVYQNVLALANKEQRGYITPQEFNLFARQAQMEIFEQYFYDINQWSRQHGNSHEYGDILTNLEEKISGFEVYDSAGLAITALTGEVSLGSLTDIYRLGTVKVTYTSQGETQYSIAEQVQGNELVKYQKSPLAKPSFKRPCYVLLSSGSGGNLAMKVYPNPDVTDIVSVDYIKKPLNPTWGYVVVTGKALYDPNPSKTIHFELHKSEEVELIYKILKLAGVTIQRDDLAKAGQNMAAAMVQQEKQ